jgi:hypothetical protein
MKKIKKIIRYSYWCLAHINYKHFEEDGETGKIILSIITFFGFIDVIVFFRVLFFHHVDLREILGELNTNYFKIFGLVICVLIYYFFQKIFKNFPIKNNKEFFSVSKSKRIYHTVLIFLFLILEFYVFMVILSPTFHPNQLIGNG